MSKALISALYDNVKYNKSRSVEADEVSVRFMHKTISALFLSAATTLENVMYQLPAFTPATDLTVQQVNTISSISESNIGSDRITIDWTATPPAGGQVFWGTTSGDTPNAGPLESNLIANHSYTLTGLPAGTEIFYVITSGDATSPEQSFSTTKASTFPAISSTYQRTDSNPPARPTSGNSVVDPFDTNITIKNMGSKFHFYSSRSSFSVDSSRVLLNRDVIDIDSNSVLYTIPAADSNGEHAMSNVDNDIIWACAGDLLKHIDISTGAVTNLAQFASYTSVTMGRFEGSPSADDRYIPIVGRDAADNPVAAFVFDTTINAIVNNKILAVGSGLDNTKISPDGNHLYLSYGGSGIQIAPTSDVTATVVSSVFPQHSDTAIEDGTGDSVFVNFTDGSTLTVLKSDGSSYDIALGFNTSNGHISGRCTTTPGWVLISSYSTRQLVAVKIKQGTPEFRHYGFHRGADYDDAIRAWPVGYDSIAKSCVSPDFSRIASHSEWNNTAARECYIHTYS